GSVPPPADMSDAKAVRTAMQARDSLRQQFFEPAEYEALFAEEAALDRHTLARMEIAGDRTLTASQRADAMRAAEAALPQGAQAVAERLLAGARPTHENAFKLPLAERTLAAALSQARS
ncbi:lipase secretion chaperone, partial [Salmonella enterica]